MMKWWTEIISVASKDPWAFGAFLVLVVWSLARSWFTNAHLWVRTVIFLVLLVAVYLAGDRFVKADRLVHLAPSKVLAVDLPAQTVDATDLVRQIDANLPLLLRRRKLIAFSYRSVEDAYRAAGVAGVAFSFLISKPANATAYARIIPLVPSVPGACTDPNPETISRRAPRDPQFRSVERAADCIAQWYTDPVNLECSSAPNGP